MKLFDGSSVQTLAQLKDLQMLCFAESQEYDKEQHRARTHNHKSAHLHVDLIPNVQI